MSSTTVGPATRRTGSRTAGGRALTGRGLPRPGLLGLLDRPLASYYLVLGSAGLLLALGLIMVLSASSVTSYAASGSSFAIAKKQALWVAVGLPAMWVGMRLPVKAYRWFAYPLLLGSLALMLLVLVPGVGVNVSGATRWITIGGLQIQPSEPAKLALVLWGADLLARKDARLAETRHLMVPLVPVALLLALLVMLQPDMGTTVVLVTVMLALLFTAGAPLRAFGGVGAGLGVAMGFLAVAEPYRLARLTGFRHPCGQQHALGIGYQACQGIYALSSGGWFGVGLGGSREKFGYLPNQYTDYIFAIIGEELGLLGTMVVLGLFALLGYAGIRIAQRSTDRFSQLAAAGVTAWLLGQALVNMGAVVGLLPITGIPLPLVSFGGSALVPTMFAIGMLASFARREPGAARALAARSSVRSSRLAGRLRGR